MNVPIGRTILGALLFLVLVGEVTVGYANGLFTAPGLIVLGLLYVFYFLLLEAIIFRCRLDNVGIVLVNFALYSVLITGLLHGEIAYYVTRPEDTIITTLIRIQCSLFPLFALYVLREIVPKPQKTISVRRAGLLFGVFVMILSASDSIGVGMFVRTFMAAPVYAAVFSLLAVVSFVTAIRRAARTRAYTNQLFGWSGWLLVIIGLVPGLPSFVILMLMMIVIAAVFLAKPDFRKASVA